MNHQIQNILCALLFSTALISTAQAGTVEASDAGKEWEKRRTRTVRPAKAPDARDNFGGFDGEKVANKRGFFRVIQKGKKWWLVNPNGNLFFSVGVNSVEPKRVGSEDKEAWAEETYQLLDEAGFNSIGRWSDHRPFARIDKPIPWCSTLGFMRTFDSQRSEDLGRKDYPYETIPVFDEGWPAFCEKFALEKTRASLDDPYLIGHFSDNELPFRPDALNNYLSLSKTDPGYIAAVAWMEENKISKRRINDPKVQAAFLEVVAKLYFETVANALKKADPNHLYLGSRLHGRCINEPVLRCLLYTSPSPRD